MEGLLRLSNGIFNVFAVCVQDGAKITFYNREFGKNENKKKSEIAKIDINLSTITGSIVNPKAFTIQTENGVFYECLCPTISNRDSWLCSFGVTSVPLSEPGQIQLGLHEPVVTHITLHNLDTMKMLSIRINKWNHFQMN